MFKKHHSKKKRADEERQERVCETGGEHRTLHIALFLSVVRTRSLVGEKKKKREKKVIGREEEGEEQR